MNLTIFFPTSPKLLLSLLALIVALAATALIVLSSTATDLDPQLGRDPLNPMPLQPGLTLGKVPPQSTTWLSFQYVDHSGQHKFKELDFTLFATPSDGNLQHHLNFELFELGQRELWLRGEGHLMQNFGAGMLVSRDGDDLTAERSWRGVVVMGDVYLLGIKNGTDAEIDFYLFDADIINAELGELAAAAAPPAEPTATPAPTPAPVVLDGGSPQTAMPLQPGANKGGLQPGQEVWYSFSVTDFDQEFFEPMALTMIATPDDGHRIRYMIFDVYPAGAVHDWPHIAKLRERSFGTGSVVYRDANPATGERFWHGWIIDNDRYLVRLYNGTEMTMDYWLYDDDVYGPELN